MSKIINPEGWTRQDYLAFYHDVWGCPCIPIARSKKAAVKWAKYQTEMPTLDDYKNWFNSAYGVAIIMRNGLFSVDLDTDELFKRLRGEGAFPLGACIYKSRRGYHVIMRANHCDRNFPYSVPEHNPDLINIDPLFDEFGVGGVNHLSNVPDTPDRLWLPGCLFDEPAEVDYEKWLEGTLDWSKRAPGARDTEGDLHIFCPLHPDKETGTPSLVINAKRNSAHCFGCNWHGNFTELMEECRRKGAEPPVEVRGQIAVHIAARTGDFRSGRRTLDAPVVDRLISAGRYGVTQITADSGEGKTTVICKLAADVALNRPVFGGLPARQCVVTIFDFEGIRDMLSIALEQVLGPDVDKVPLNQINISSKDIGQYNVMNPLDREALIGDLKAYGAGLCIMDSIIWFLDDPNDQPQVDMCKKFLERIMQEVGCAILITMHTSRSDGFSDSYDRPYGILGHMLKRWVSSKLSFSRLKGSEFYSMIQGRTREWGQVRHFLGYREDTRSMVLMPPDDIPARYLTQLDRAAVDDTTRLAEMIKIVAREEGITVAQVADILQVDRRSISYWACGENEPSPENYDAMRALLRRLQSEPDNVREELGVDGAAGRPHPERRGPIPKMSLGIERCSLGIGLQTPKANGVKKLATKQKAPPLSEDFDSIYNTLTSDVKGKGLEPYRFNDLTSNPLTLKYGSIALDTKGGTPGCEKCKLKGAEGGAVEGRGYGKNGVMLIGEAPEPQVAKGGSSLADPCDKYLNDLTALAKIDTDNCRITNLIQCSPGRDAKGKVKKPTLAPVRLCLPRLIAEIEKYHPALIIMMGDYLVSALFPQHTLARMHGKRWQVGNVEYAAMYHPNAGLHNPYFRPILDYDWKNLMLTPLLQEISGDYRIDDDGDFVSIVEATVDVETTGLSRDARLLGGSVCIKPGRATYYSTPEKLLGALKRLKIWTMRGHNLKFDLQVLARYGYEI